MAFLWASLKSSILELLADNVMRGEGCWLQPSRLRMLNRKSFCRGDVQPHTGGTKRRDLHAWGFAVGSQSRSGVMLIISCSQQEVTLGMSLPAVLKGCSTATLYPVLEQHLGTACACLAPGK